MIEITAGNPLQLTIEFRDYDGDLAAPDTATYRVDSEGVEIRTDTSVPGLDSSVTLLLDATDTGMQDTDKTEEIHCLTVVANHSGESPCTEFHRFKAMNRSCEAV